MQVYTNIYELIDPRTNLPRYIGRCVGPVNKRLSNHLSEARSSTRRNHRIHWLKELIQLDLKPICNTIAIVNTDDWQIWEQFYVQLYKELGFDLVNGSIGGDGFEPGQVPWNKGKKGISEVTRKKMSDARKLRVTSQETKDKMSKSKKGKVPPYMKDGIPIEALEKMSKTWFGTTPVWNKGITGYSTKKKGYVMPQETKDKIRATKLGSKYKQK